MLHTLFKVYKNHQIFPFNPPPPFPEKDDESTDVRTS